MVDDRRRGFEPVLTGELDENDEVDGASTKQHHKVILTLKQA